MRRRGAAGGHRLFSPFFFISVHHFSLSFETNIVLFRIAVTSATDTRWEPTTIGRRVHVRVLLFVARGGGREGCGVRYRWPCRHLLSQHFD